ncbi:hypothetical protein [Arthrobacter sp. StoSoilB5]|uniref:hypothetical protein n=1 Tax=Arthrobacter sp. StoSoilB5 TaxID=2830992 RepID=UPI001CC57640|nr:hypothetical protein [Arthrobacter sp. StoSoilB5]BCW44794.1 hypothetical protein StoSoilB5_19780 [Arthrobacter sp. StoSoilB5]
MGAGALPQAHSASLGVVIALTPQLVDEGIKRMIDGKHGELLAVAFSGLYLALNQAKW